MNRFLGCLAPVTLLLVATYSQAQTIDTFHLFADPVNIHYPEENVMQVGAEGDIWLTLPMPQRLMRISGDQAECVFNSGIMTEWAPSLTISPDGTLWIGRFEYIYSYSTEDGLHTSDVEIPPSYSGPGASVGVWGPMIDANDRMFLCGGCSSWDKQQSSCVWEVRSGQSPVKLFEAYDLQWPFLVSASELWAEGTMYKQGSSDLWEIDLAAGVVKAEYETAPSMLQVKDSEGVFWSAGYSGIMTFDRQDVSLHCEPGDGFRFGWPMVLTADWTIWVASTTEQREPRGVVRIQGDERRSFTTEDGLLTNSCWWPKTDYDGRVWFFNANDDGIIGLSRITDGGWPPMRLMLHRLDTPDSISVEAQVINNGPVVGVDVYVALQMNGQLLFWPSWQPEQCPVQVNLRPGHNQTATIISAPRSSIPPGSYTFFSCMTGRTTHKLIGPIDRKFESLTIEVN